MKRTANAGVAMTDTTFQGTRFLILEDEPLIALDIASEIENLGGRIAADVRSVTAAAEALDKIAFDAAVLDFRLSDGTSTAIGEALQSRGTPFVFCTGGLSEEAAEGPLSDITVWQKPCDWPSLLREFAQNIRTPERLDV